MTIPAIVEGNGGVGTGMKRIPTIAKPLDKLLSKYNSKSLSSVFLHLHIVL